MGFTITAYLIGERVVRRPAVSRVPRPHAAKNKQNQRKKKICVGHVHEDFSPRITPSSAWKLGRASRRKRGLETACLVVAATEQTVGTSVGFFYNMGDGCRIWGGEGGEQRWDKVVKFLRVLLCMLFLAAVQVFADAQRHGRSTFSTVFSECHVQRRR